MTKLYVIDVSEHNGRIAWERVTDDAAIIRAGYRGYGTAGTLVCDKRFHENVSAANRVGIPVGAYWLSQAVSDREAVEEARYLIGLLAPYRIEYPVYLDSEYCEPNGNGRGDSIGKDRRTRYALSFLGELKKAGYTAGLYCSESWFSDEIDGSAIRAAVYTVWCARLSGKPRIGAYDAWQYTWSGRSAGCVGRVDRSEFYRDFAKREDSTERVAREVIAGLWGNGGERVRRLLAAGHDYAAVQRRVNELLGG